MLQRILVRTAAGAAFAMISGAAYADSISPVSFTDTIPVGGTTGVDKRVTVSAGAPTSAQVDVVFLTDTTGSMGGFIGAVQAGFGTIATNLSGLGNVHFAVQEYRDVGDAFVWRENTAMTGVVASVQAGINLYAAAGGGDTPEANLYALEQAADTTAWRAGSARFVVWAGDAPGHDPRNGSTEASATAALVAAGAEVIALDLSSLNSSGQAGRITAATGGSLESGVVPADIVDIISDAIVSAFAEYTSVCLDTSEAPAGLTVTSSACIVGAFDRSVERTFDFNLSIDGDAPGTYDFNVYATVDGGRVASERDLITVTDDVPEPASLALISVGLIGLGVGRRFRRRRA